ncbi:MAG: flagellar export chaperone FliS [Brevibacillus sp.]|nr:flagellar export chaperone FliS [Brevibacillus sp.]
MLHSAAQAYQNNQVTTATPAELTLMLYNGALRFIKQAKAAMDGRQVEQAHQYCIRVQEILYELMSTLNRDYPIADDFLKMYEYMLRRTIEANVKKDASILAEVEDLFVQFRDTWKEAMTLAKQQG